METIPQNIIDISIIKGDIKTLKKYFEAGYTIQHPMCIDTMIEKKERPKILELLHSHGVDLTQRGNILFFRACIYKKIKTATYLSKFIPYNDRVFSLAITNLIGKFPNATNELNDFFKLIFPCIDKEQFKTIFSNIKIKNQYLYNNISHISLNAHITQTENIKHRTNKI